MDIKKENSSKIQGAIVETVAFFDLFDFPMTAFEIWKNINIKCSLEDIFFELKKENKYLDNKNGFWFLKGRQDIINIRMSRYNYADRKFKRALKISRIFKFIPWIKMIAIGNIIGSHNLKNEGDIDFFIITEKKRIWLTRFFCVLLVKFLGLRPKPDYAKDKICLSFFIDEEEINLKKLRLDFPKQDYYFIYWLAGLVPIYDKEGLYQKLIKENNWLKDYLPNWNRGNINYLRDAGRGLSFFYRDIIDMLFGGLEKKIKIFSLKMMAQEIKDIMNKDTRVVVSDHVLKFHTNDRREEIRRSYLEKIKNYK